MNNLTNSARIATPVRQENEHPDYRISEAFKSAHGSRFRYDVSSGRWLEFDGNILRTTRPGRVRFLAKGLAVKLGFGQQSHLLGAERMLQDDEELVVSAEARFGPDAPRDAKRACRSCNGQIGSSED